MGRRAVKRKITPPRHLREETEEINSANNLDQKNGKPKQFSRAASAPKKKKLNNTKKDEAEATPDNLVKKGKKTKSSIKKGLSEKPVVSEDEGLELNAPNDDSIGMSENEGGDTLCAAVSQKDKQKCFSIEDLEEIFLKDDKFFNKFMDKKKEELEQQNCEKIQQLEALKQWKVSPADEEPQPSTSRGSGNEQNINLNARTASDSTGNQSPAEESVYLSAAKFIEANRKRFSGETSNNQLWEQWWSEQ